VSVDEAYNVKYGVTSPSDIGLKITTTSGETKKIRFYYNPVNITLPSTADVFVCPLGNSMNGQGACQVIEVQGINVNKCLLANGASVKANVTLNGKPHTFTLKGQDQTKQSSIDDGSDGKFEFLVNAPTNDGIILNVISDTASNGMIIGCGNGGHPDHYVSGQTGTLNVEIIITPTVPGNSPYTSTLNYKFRISNNVL